MGKIRFGIIGAGNRAVGLCRDLTRIPGVQIVAVNDPDKKRLANLANDYNINEENRFRDYKELLQLDELDAVIITSPDYTHHEIVINSAMKKKHIFCEKPMALTLKDCLQMKKAVEENGVIFLLGFCLRYNNLYKKVKELISSGVIGNIKIVNAVDSVERGSSYFFHSWHRRKKYSGGLLPQKATHSLDIINWMTESEPVSVYALGSLDVFGGNEPDDKRCSNCKEKKTCKEFIDSEHYHSDYMSGEKFIVEDRCVFASEVDIHDNEVLLINYKNGTKASFTECNFTPDYKRKFEFIGDRGRISVQDFYSHNGKFQPYKHKTEVIISKRHSNEIITINPELRKGGHGGGDPAMIEDLVKVFRGEKEPLTDVKTGILSTAIAFTAEKSIESGKVERIMIQGNI
ncbi:Gfo/Idh/MocA family oxidoreductase [bacterium]|nr:Gfo/Idh/MocA family oxidoreductase [bacterium]